MHHRRLLWAYRVSTLLLFGAALAFALRPPLP